MLIKSMGIIASIATAHLIKNIQSKFGIKQ